MAESRQILFRAKPKNWRTNKKDNIMITLNNIKGLSNIHNIPKQILINKDIRLHFYVKSIASLHKLSDYGVNVSDGFFDESLNYLEKNIYKLKNLEIIC